MPAATPAMAAPTATRMMMWKPFLAFEFGFSFLQKSADPFGVIVAGAQFAHKIAFKVELPVEGIAQALIQCLFRIRQPFGRRVGKMRQQLVEPARKRLVGTALQDQAPLSGLLGAQLLAQRPQKHTSELQ